MGHKLDAYDIEELKENMNDLDDLIFVVGCMVERAYNCGYDEAQEDLAKECNHDADNTYTMMDREYNI